MPELHLRKGSGGLRSSGSKEGRAASDDGSAAWLAWRRPAELWKGQDQNLLGHRLSLGQMVAGGRLLAILWMFQREKGEMSEKGETGRDPSLRFIAEF